MPNMPTVDDVLTGWQRHFYAADRSLRWMGVEQEFAVPLHIQDMPVEAWLVTHMDAYGPDWFADWKTAKPESAKNKGAWKEKWRFHPQSLTYGLMGRYLGWQTKRFTIRMVFKSDPPTFDHEWFSYSDAEIDAWEHRVIGIAEEVANLAAGRVNPGSCLRYGRDYACSFLPGCSQADFTYAPPTLVQIADPMQRGRITEHVIPNDAIILSATRIETYLECPEKFRRIYVEGWQEPPNASLQFGAQFHETIAQYNRQFIP